MRNTRIRTSIVMCIACVTLTSMVFGFLGNSQFLYAQGEANETFFEMTMREAEQQQNQTAAAPPPAPPAQQQNQTAQTNPLEQLGQAISKLFGGGK